ncbi:hypothetical protein [Streptomyces sp. HUAS TT7]|uniref:hypothetical protein n=1 Tax=Streptomyces sp. HUAS TT7 TaxID=3447507 RepID=UPI003F65DF15
MPASVIDSPLGIECVFSDGSASRRFVGSELNPQLVRTLLTGLSDLVHPHGDLDKNNTISLYLTALRYLVRALDAEGFHGDAGELTRARLAAYWMSGIRSMHEQAQRQMLRSADDQLGILAPEVRALVDGRNFNQRRREGLTPLQPYSEGEWQRMTETSRRIVKQSYAEHKKALALAGQGQDPHEHGWTSENVQWFLHTYGPEIGQRELKARASKWGRKLEVDGDVPELLSGLFPPPKVLVSYRILFGIYTGIVPDGIAGLGLDDIDWAGDETVVLDYLKGRTAAESMTLSPRATRLLQQLLNHSAVARRFAPADVREDLWVRYWITPPHWASRPPDKRLIRLWVVNQGLLGDDGKPLRIHQHRIRTTHSAMRDRSQWRGTRRTVIDPNRSPAVEGDSYLTLGTGEQRDAVEEIIAAAQADMVRRAEPPVVLHSEETAELLRDYPEHVARLGLDDGALRELVGGRRDVFTAACGDQLSGLHGPKGKPCPARPWVCLLCPLAVFTPRHLPNLLRLKAFFSRQWQQLTSDQFMSVFGPYAQRLDDIVRPGTYFTENALAEAAGQVADSDDEIPLRPEETTA